MAQSCGVGHRSLMTPERVLSEYNEDLIFDILVMVRYGVDYQQVM